MIYDLRDVDDAIFPGWKEAQTREICMEQKVLHAINGRCPYPYLSLICALLPRQERRYLFHPGGTTKLSISQIAYPSAHSFSGRLQIYILS